MRISVILAHPEPKSFNHAIARTVVEQLERNGHGISFHEISASLKTRLRPSGETASLACMASPLFTVARSVSL
jgi:hypothetical protein